MRGGSTTGAVYQIDEIRFLSTVVPERELMQAITDGAPLELLAPGVQAFARRYVEPSGGRPSREGQNKTIALCVKLLRLAGMGAAEAHETVANFAHLSAGTVKQIAGKYG